MSLNGKIARTDGRVDWLESIPNPDKTDYGYADFYQSIDTTIQGYETYAKIMDWDIPFPYAGKQNYVLTRKRDLSDTEYVNFVSEHPLEFIQQLKSQPGRDIWLIGGGQINTLLFNAGLIDDARIFVMPIVIPDGIELFASSPEEKQLRLIELIPYSSGVVEMRYATKKDGMI